jgi:hypothetical protein
MRKRRDSKIQWGHTGRQRQASTLSEATPFREGGNPRVQLFSHLFHTALHQTVLELDQMETLTREFLIRRAKSGDAFAARMLRDRYRVRVATVEELHHENQRRGLEAPAGRNGGSHDEQPGPAVRGPDPRIDDGAV